ncbi:putative LRR receptor-like serine/threonine-protein kinase [Prunus yedoensis var. nudiflora]|uniref:Putative LRR receptor-like serine/threonine-protein kinase n=1 Tax=Prunus yedoensis var. nudiflora TaxID=2094558 RepID=A0A314Z7X0_PRUYE|nr:putative LRR receptor-like serine/threonine-protein kinase [Prunus yedoensis var. nudiflora]
MYSHVDSNYALLLANGHTDGIQMMQMRIWVPANGFIVTENVKGEARSIDTSSAQDNPPEAVLQNAVETIGTL